jgi:hypothetical protein
MHLVTTQENGVAVTARGAFLFVPGAERAAGRISFAVHA